MTLNSLTCRCCNLKSQLRVPRQAINLKLSVLSFLQFFFCNNNNKKYVSFNRQMSGLSALQKSQTIRDPVSGEPLYDKSEQYSFPEY